MIPENYDLWEAHDREQARWLDSLPECECCGQPIQQEMAVCIDGFWYCDRCIERYRKEINIE